MSGTVNRGNSVSGVGIYQEAQSNTIGGTTEGERDIVSGNGESGVLISDAGTNNNKIKGAKSNFIEGES